jgi:sterol desaturase/sphingolipid hydroxylase (fatty acid hydroxylase superfamily)
VSRRDEIFASIPPSYSGARHFAIVNALGAAALAAPLYLLRSPTAADLLAVPVAFLLISLGEWELHRNVLHRRVRGLELLYQRHALTHHVAFHHDTMAAPSAREWRWVLFPAPAFLGMMLAVAPVGALFALAWGRNAGLLFFATGAAFYLLYEWCHLSYHLPPDSRVGRLPLVVALRRHHQRHHHPALAKRYNFNVTFPIWDLLRGTLAPRDAEARADEEIAAGRPAPG